MDYYYRQQNQPIVSFDQTRVDGCSISCCVQPAEWLSKVEKLTLERMHNWMEWMENKRTNDLPGKLEMRMSRYT